MLAIQELDAQGYSNVVVSTRSVLEIKDIECGALTSMRKSLVYYLLIRRYNPACTMIKDALFVKGNFFQEMRVAH